MSLLPANYDQITFTAALFPLGHTKLIKGIRQCLNLVALYVKHYPTVEYIYIDGHSDNVGSRRQNRELSKERAE